MKICTKCKTEKHTELYGKGNDKDGLRFWCKPCHNQANSIYEKSNKEKVNARKRKYAKSEKGRYNNRNKQLKNKYGITQLGYEQMLEKQNGCCAICFNEETSLWKNGQIMPLSIDHDHLTGKVRKLLCAQCNHGLGNFNDDVSLIKKAIKYLTKEQVMPDFARMVNIVFNGEI